MTRRQHVRSRYPIVSGLACLLGCLVVIGALAPWGLALLLGAFLILTVVFTRKEYRDGRSNPRQ